MEALEIRIAEVDDPVLPNLKDCKGQIYRFALDRWVGSDADVNVRYRYRYLASKSCSGCEKCAWLNEALREHLSNLAYGFGGEVHEYDTPVVGALYQLKMVNVSTDWESGYVDDFDIAFERMPT